MENTTRLKTRSAIQSRFRSRLPRLLIGGSGEKFLLRTVARYGDACNLFELPETVKKKLAVLRMHCEAAGRDYDSILKTKTHSRPYQQRRRRGKPEGSGIVEYDASRDVERGYDIRHSKTGPRPDRGICRRGNRVPDYKLQWPQRITILDAFRRNRTPKVLMHRICRNEFYPATAALTLFSRIIFLTYSSNLLSKVPAVFSGMPLNSGCADNATSHADHCSHVSSSIHFFA